MKEIEARDLFMILFGCAATISILDPKLARKLAKEIEREKNRKRLNDMLMDKCFPKKRKGMFGFVDSLVEMIK